MSDPDRESGIRSYKLVDSHAQLTAANAEQSDSGATGVASPEYGEMAERLKALPC